MDAYRVATRVEMADLRTGSRTIVILHDVQLDRPQPGDRYIAAESRGAESIVNPRLLSFGAAAAAVARSAWLVPVSIAPSMCVRRLPRSESVRRGNRQRASPSTWSWATALIRADAIGAAQVDASVRFEASASPAAGPAADPADRRLQRVAGVDPHARADDAVAARRRSRGRAIRRGVGRNDGYSPADAFLPRATFRCADRRSGSSFKAPTARATPQRAI